MTDDYAFTIEQFARTLQRSIALAKQRGPTRPDTAAYVCPPGVTVTGRINKQDLPYERLLCYRSSAPVAQVRPGWLPTLLAWGELEARVLAWEATNKGGKDV